MKRFINTFVCSLLYCVAAMGLASCVEEEFLQDGITSSETFSLTVTQEQKDKTKLTLGDDFLTTYWEDGDVLYLQKVGDSSKRYTLTTSLDAPSTTAVFTYSGGALSGGTYYVYYNDSEFGGDIQFDNSEYIGLQDKDKTGYYMSFYGIIDIKKGQSSAKVELKPVYSMLHFTIKNNNSEIPANLVTKYFGMVAPKTGFVQEQELQADGTLMETENRLAKWEIYTSVRNFSEIDEYRALILPVDLSNQTVYFYVSFFQNNDDGTCKEYVYELPKQGKELKAGVCYHITLDLSSANKYDLSDRELSSPEDFRALAYHTNYFSYREGSNTVIKPYTVTQDIDFTGKEYFPITASSSELIIDGNNKTLSNISIDWPLDGAGLMGSGSAQIYDLNIDKATISGKDYVGAFCGLGSSLSLKNCKLTKSTIKGENYVGGLHGGEVGTNTCSIAGCHVESSSITAECNVGGIAGQIKYMSDSKVDDATSVKGKDYVGGIAGYANGSIKSCSSSATVTATGEYAGGIVGATQSIDVMYTSQGYAYRCANTGSVNGNTYVGGIVGYAYGDVAFDECYSIGNVSGSECVGGIAGFADQPITYCYTLGDVTGTDYVGGIVGQWSVRSGDKYRIKYCYSAGAVSSDRGIIGGFSYDGNNIAAVIDCITTSKEIGDRRTNYINGNEDSERTSLTDINSKIYVVDPNDDMYFTDRVWDPNRYPYNCTILLWQGPDFGVEVTSGN